MAKVAPVVVVRCAGCGAQFDDEKDVCPIPHVVGNHDVGSLCPRCHVTALGNPQPHEYRQAALLK